MLLSVVHLDRSTFRYKRPLLSAFAQEGQKSFVGTHRSLRWMGSVHHAFVLSCTRRDRKVLDTNMSAVAGVKNLSADALPIIFWCITTSPRGCRVILKFFESSSLVLRS